MQKNSGDLLIGHRLPRASYYLAGIATPALTHGASISAKSYNGCMRRGAVSSRSLQDACELESGVDARIKPLCPCQTSKDRRIMATRCEQHETMPDRVVKAQAPPDMKQRAKRVEDAANREQP